ncbi:MAG: hypothetical protein ABSB34_03085 [Candidatus Limnocylindrales bacterium]
MATRPAEVPASESTNARPDGVPAACQDKPSELVQTVSDGLAVEGSPAKATSPAGEAATSTRGATIAVTCVHVWPSTEVHTSPLDHPFVDPYAA